MIAWIILSYLLLHVCKLLLAEEKVIYSCRFIPQACYNVRKLEIRQARLVLYNSICRAVVHRHYQDKSWKFLFMFYTHLAPNVQQHLLPCQWSSVTF